MARARKLEEIEDSLRPDLELLDRLYDDFPGGQLSLWNGFQLLAQLQTLTRLLATHMNMQRHLHPCLDVFPEQDEGDKLCEAENEPPRQS